METSTDWKVMQQIKVVDSHTGGEPTRVVVEGITLLGDDMAVLRADFQARLDHLRTGLVREPRGSDVLVGALLTPPVSEGSAAGVIFFNDVGYLGMCGHGMIGVVETVRHLGLIEPGPIRLDTPVGPVTATLREDGDVQVQNVTSYRYRGDVELEVAGVGPVVGDVAYGGNWFFVVQTPHFEVGLGRVEELTETAWTIRHALAAAGITGRDGAEIDHIELEGLEDPLLGDAEQRDAPTQSSGAEGTVLNPRESGLFRPNPSSPPHAEDARTPSRNFVLCPGGAYDRSPCGTGTSAKMACLYARGKLAAGEWYVQESVTGSRFRGFVVPVVGGVSPTIVGRAHITGEATLLFADDDPIRWGLAY